MTGLAGRRLVVGGVVAVLLAPLVPVLLWAVAGRYRYPAVLPADVDDRGLRLLLDGQVPGALATSLGISAAVAALACAVGLPAGRALGRHRFPGRGVVQGLLLAPVVVPPLAAVVGIQVFFVRYGLADTVAGVVLVQLMPTVPYAATLLGAAVASLDPDVERQARVLGAGPLRTLSAVSLPMLRPALVTTFLLTFLISWSDYLLTLLVGGGTVTTLPLLLFAAVGSADRTVAAALGLLVVLPPVVVVVVVHRLLGTRGAATSAWTGMNRA